MGKDWVGNGNSIYKTLGASNHAEAERDLDDYRFAFFNLIGYLNGKFGKNYKPAIQKGIAASDEVNEMIQALFDSAFTLRGRFDELWRLHYGEEERDGVTPLR